MQIIKVKPLGFGSNSYILTEDGKNAVVIDCAEPALFDVCAEKNLTVAAVLLTHGHFDHVGGCGRFYAAGVPIYCGEFEKALIHSPENRNIFGGVFIPEFEIEKTLKDGEEITIADITVKALHTPGHTAGGITYVAGGNLFTGDTLFRLSIGRCDLPTGDGKKLLESVNMLFALDGDYKVYCGHEEDTTLAYERKFNPYAKH